MSKLTGYAGTYQSPESLGVYSFTLDTGSGALEGPALYQESPDAKYLSLWNGWLAAPVAREAGAGVLLLDTGNPGGAAREALGEAVTSCHVEQDESRVYAANFHEGCVSVYEKPGLNLIRRVEIAPKAGCHQVLFHGDFLLAPCLELDEIRLFRRDTLEPAGAIPFPAGSGPRHGVFNKAHSRLFVAGQRSHSVFCFRAAGADFMLEAEASALPGPGRPADETAAIRLSPEEDYLYVSTRGPDLITVFRVREHGLETVQHAGSGGKHPRDFILTGDGRFLLAANRFGGGIVCFRRDSSTGRLMEVCGRIPLAQAVALALRESPGGAGCGNRPTKAEILEDDYEAV